MLTQAWRGADDVPPVIAERLAGYPPLFLWINMGVQSLYDTFTTKLWLMPSDYIYAARIFTVIVGLATTAVMVTLGWQLGGLVWGLSPMLVDHNSRAIPDPLVYLACAAALSMAVRAWYKRSPAWLTGSLVSAVLAVYGKYWPVHSLIPFVVVSRAYARKWASNAALDCGYRRL